MYLLKVFRRNAKQSFWERKEHFCDILPWQGRHRCVALHSPRFLCPSQTLFLRYFVPSCSFLSSSTKTVLVKQTKMTSSPSSAIPINNKWPLFWWNIFNIQRLRVIFRQMPEGFAVAMFFVVFLKFILNKGVFPADLTLSRPSMATKRPFNKCTLKLKTIIYDKKRQAQT